MSSIERGLDAFRAGQYAGALACFRQALAEVRAAGERERLWMWIARCSLEIGDEAQLLDACAVLLGSPSARLRAFARAGLGRCGLAHPVAPDAPPSLLKAAGRVYSERFWALVIPGLQAGVWAAALSLVGAGWCGLMLGQMQTQTGTAIQLAWLAWWWLLALILPGICLLLALDRLLRAIERQRRLALEGLVALGTLARRGPERLIVLVLTLAVAVILVGLGQWQWWAAAFIGLTVQPWLVSLWLALRLD